MNVYRAIGNTIGTTEARALSERLVAWHDAMVTHTRAAANPECDDECPHDQARLLWREAQEIFGREAARLTFLRRHGDPEARDATGLEACA